MRFQVDERLTFGLRSETDARKDGVTGMTELLAEFHVREREVSATLPPINTNLALPQVSLIIQRLAKTKNLPDLLPRLPKCAYEVIIVDGRSTRRTVEVAQRLRPDLVIAWEPTRGKGAVCEPGSRRRRVMSS